MLGKRFRRYDGAAPTSKLDWRVGILKPSVIPPFSEEMPQRDGFLLRRGQGTLCEHSARGILSHGSQTINRSGGEARPPRHSQHSSPDLPRALRCRMGGGGHAFKTPLLE